MKRKNATRNALFTSIISLLLCVSMLVGTTFAWFTDSVESGLNTITAGNLDVELYHSNKGATNEKVITSTKLFDDVTLWEPGAVAYENLQVKNEGNLALKYQMALNFANATDNGAGKTLADVLKVAVVEGGFNGNRADAHALTYNYDLASFSLNGALEKGEESDIFGIVIYWEPTANDNDFNMNNENQGKVLSIDLGINLFATQEMYEADSFDDTYDKDTEVFTVAEANAMLAENKDVTLINCIETDGVIEIPAGYTGKLILKNSTIASVQAEATANITILGNVTVDASALTDTSAITGTVLNINGNGNLTAIASGLHAYGIGGDQTTEITIEGVHIVDVKGGHVQPNFINDTSYGKSEPEGGAAIGSGHSGAVITLKGVTIDNAQGGSKAAGIGARYWTGVTININNSVIKNVEGGNASAGIGGSRVSDDVAPAGQHVKININNSSINATGGQFGAGIGSGYDTHCGENITETICTINIDANSSITAQGGKYAAGVGTGYHVAALAGNIECAVNATAGESREKYTIAQAVGFGVVDHTREVAKLTTAPSITYQGAVITVPDAQITNNDELTAALQAGKTEITLAAGNFTLPSSAAGKTLTISGTKDTKISVQSGLSYANGATITFEGVTIQSDPEGAGYTNGFADFKYAKFNNCVINGTLGLDFSCEFNNCEFNISGDYYNVWTWGAGTAMFNGCTFNSDGKALLVYANVLDNGTNCQTVKLTDCVFNDNGGLTDLKAAIEIGDDYGKSYELVINNTVVNGYEINDKGINTGSTLWANKNSLGGDRLKVTIDGEAVIIPAAWENIDVANADVTRENMIAEEYVEICHNGGNMTLENVVFENGLTIYSTNTANNGTITLKGCTIYLNDGTGDPNYTSKTQYSKDRGLNLNLANGSTVKVVFENCTFTAAANYTYTGVNSYNVYITGNTSADSITFTGCTFEGSGKHGIGCSADGTAEYYNLTVTGCNFKNWNNDSAHDNGAAIRGNLNDNCSGNVINISGNTFGNNNGSTQTTVAIDSWTGSWS